MQTRIKDYILAKVSVYNKRFLKVCTKYDFQKQKNGGILQVVPLS